jgi:hypothetical protein
MIGSSDAKTRIEIRRGEGRGEEEEAEIDELMDEYIFHLIPEIKSTITIDLYNTSLNSMNMVNLHLTC